MGSAPDYVRKKFGPLREKTLQTVIAQLIAEQFPRIGGPRIQAFCADMVLQRIAEVIRSRDQLTHGQILWLAVDRDERPKHRQRIRDTRLVPVILDLSTSQDIEDRIARRSTMERLTAKAVRLCQQAYEQRGLLSNCDLAELLALAESSVARLLTQHETKTGRIVPRRATLHDVGTGLTHKGIICRKRYLEGKESHVIAQETYHSLEAVDRYLGQFDRVRCCRKLGMSPEETAYTLNCSLGLVHQYLDIDKQLESKS
jgi:Protein of unknown function (DUF1670)